MTTHPPNRPWASGSRSSPFWGYLGSVVSFVLDPVETVSPGKETQVTTHRQTSLISRLLAFGVVASIFLGLGFVLTYWSGYAFRMGWEAAG